MLSPGQEGILLGTGQRSQTFDWVYIPEMVVFLMGNDDGRASSGKGLEKLEISDI